MFSLPLKERNISRGLAGAPRVAFASVTRVNQCDDILDRPSRSVTPAAIAGVTFKVL